MLEEEEAKRERKGGGGEKDDHDDTASYITCIFRNPCRHYMQFQEIKTQCVTAVHSLPWKPGLLPRKNRLIWELMESILVGENRWHRVSTHLWQRDIFMTDHAHMTIIWGKCPQDAVKFEYLTCPPKLPISYLEEDKLPTTYVNQYCF